MKRLRERARIVARIRAFFDARNFLEVETPLLVPSPGLDLHLDAFGLPTPSGPRFLATSPEYQMKRLLADGYERVYQISKCFRKDEVGERHNPEFSMLEWYRANAGVGDVMRDTEELVETITGGTVVIPRGWGGERFNVETRVPFVRMTVCEAFSNFAGVSPDETLAMAEEDEDRYFRLLVEQVEPGLATVESAVFLTEYPAVHASLARKKPGSPRVAERFELYVAGVELCNGFGELVDPVEQRARFEHDQRERQARGLPVYPIDERFLDALVRGIPPSGGNALGVDRLVALTCGTTDIRSVMAFSDDEL